MKEEPAITPAELRNYEFNRKMRGYDPVQVDDVIGLAAEAIEKSLVTINSLSADVRRLEEKISGFERMESTIKETLVTAQTSVDEIRRNALKEAELMKREAEAEVNRQAESHQRAAERLRVDIERLKNLRRNYLIQLKSVIKGHQETLEQLSGEFEESLGVDEHAVSHQQQD